MEAKALAGTFAHLSYTELPNPASRYGSPKLQSPQRPRQQRLTHGVPKRKRLFNWYDFTAVIGSLAALGLALAVISPLLSWRLGYNNQITIIGFLLTLQFLCARVTIQKLFLLVEARFGASTVQNYDAIRTSSIFFHNTSFFWRVALALVVALPIALSLSYKQFHGGMSTWPTRAPSDSTKAGVYGVVAPPGTYEYQARYGVGLMNNITLPFVSTTNNDTVTPDDIAYPKPYGYNILSLSPTMSAVLDGPHPLYVESIQRTLGAQDTFRLEATVNATISQLNTTIDSHRNDPAFWNQTYPVSFNGYAGEISLYQGYSLWMRTGKEVAEWGYLNRQDCIIGLLQQGPTTTDDQLNSTFYRTAQMVSISRAECTGTWTIGRGAIELTQGSCNPHKQTAVQVGTGFHFDGLALRMLFLPTLLEFLGPFANISSQFANIYGATRATSPWYAPTLTTTVGAMFWARNAALGLGASANGSIAAMPDVTYPGRDERAWSTRAAMRRAPALYVVVALLPVLHVAAWLASMAFYASPMDNFNAVALLAGADRASLEQVRGAGFSGQTDRPVRVQVVVRARGEGAAASVSTLSLGSGLSSRAGSDVEKGSESTDIRYVLGGKGSNDELNRRQRHILLH